MPTLVDALVAAPAVAALLVAVLATWQRRRPWTAATDIAVGAVILASGVGLTLVVRRDGPVTSAAGLVRVDAASAYVLVVVGLVAVTALMTGLASREERRSTDGRLTALVALFLACMSAAVVSDNLGLMWVAIEGTTITTAFLVGHRGDRRAVEAAWKYVILGSTGLAIAFLGIAVLYAASRHGGSPTMSWAELVSQAPALDQPLLRLGAALAMLGLAAKAGLAPLHWWLPDAHSQAPAPVSGLMSGVLLSVAFLGVLRIKSIADAGLGPGLARWMLVIGGLVSLLVAAAFTLTQRDLKRTLAYSSVEHMGVIALGAAAGGPLGLAAVLLHMLGHGVAKATAFATAGRIAHASGTTRLSQLAGLHARRPDLTNPLLASGAALLGFPPFPLVLSEVAVLVALVMAGLWWAAALAALLLLVAFAGIARQLAAVALGGDPAMPAATPASTASHRVAPSVVVALVVCAALTLAVWPLASVLTDAAAALLVVTP